MRILLDESVPGRFSSLLTGHTLQSPSSEEAGPASKNGKLLALAAGEFDVLLTADKGMEYQQNLVTLPVAILIVLARSNRIEDLAPAVPAIRLRRLNLVVRHPQVRAPRKKIAHGARRAGACLKRSRTCWKRRASNARATRWSSTEKR